MVRGSDVVMTRWVALAMLVAAACNSGSSGSGGAPLTTSSVQSLALTPATATVAAGSALPFTATAVFVDGTARDVTAGATWFFSNPAVVKVVSGTAFAALAGTTTVTARYDGATASATLTVTDPNAVAFTTTPATATIAKGTTVQLTATAVFSATRQDVTALATWTSSNPAAVTVERGLATGASMGSAVLTATFGGQSATTSVLVTESTLQSLSFDTAGPLTVPAGATRPLPVTGIFSDGTKQNLTSSVAWTSSAPSVAIADASGLAAAAPGTTSIRAAMGSVSTAISVNVTAATLVSIAVSASPASIAKGTASTLRASGSYSDGSARDVTSSVTWSSSSSAVTVSVAGGATGVNVGTATVTARVGTVSGSTTVTVTPATLASLAVAPASSALLAGAAQALAAIGTFSDASTQDLTAQAAWNTSDGKIATVSNDASSPGRLTAVAPGTATITATFSGKSGAASVKVTQAALVTLSVSPPRVALAQGYSVQLAAEASYEGNQTRDVTMDAAWSSSDPMVVSVTASGLVSAIGPGSATVTARYGGLSTDVTISVAAVTLEYISISPADATSPAGISQPLTAWGVFSDGTKEDISGQVTWTSSDTATAIVDGTGVVSPLKLGTVTITAGRDGVTASTPFTVTDALYQALDVNPGMATVPAGIRVALQALATYSDGSQPAMTQVTWSSSDPTVATVDARGIATGVAAGTARITATLVTCPAGASSANCTDFADVTVTSATLTSIAVTPSPAFVVVGMTRPLTATGTFSDGSVRDLSTQVTWTSSMPAVATVSTTGMVTALAAGTATITAARGSVTATATITTSARAVASIALAAPNTSIPLKYVMPITATATYDDGSHEDVTTAVSWMSSNTQVLSVSNATGTEGLASSIGYGTANVTATLFGVTSAALPVTVINATLKALYILPHPSADNAFTVAVKATTQLHAVGVFTDGSTFDLTSQCNWRAAPKSVAWVTRGAVTGSSPGSVTITAKKGRYNDTATGAVTP